MDELEDIVNVADTSYIVDGDFNSKVHLWECNTTNERGEILMRWSASKNMNLFECW